MRALVEAAPTLAELRKLPPERKCRLLLARLEFIGRGPNALNKHNLMMIRDPYGLSVGYPEEERDAVREHLLGAPWTKLVNEGYIADILGQGFYKVTQEGREFLAQSEPPEKPVEPIAPLPDSSLDAPRAFVSYSWDSPEHKRWVARLAERLHGESGVKIVFDGWHLNPGDDKLHFMEQAISRSRWVIVVCTQNYAERANRREGGVGYESSVITGEMAQQILTNKFIPVLRSGSWNSSLPSYLKSRVGVDLQADPYSEEEYERLLRVLHGELIQPPPIGAKPDFQRPKLLQKEFGDPPKSNEFASLRLRKGNRSHQGVPIQNVIGEILNTSRTRRIREYSLTLSVPRLCLRFSSAHYMLEIKSEDAEYRRFRSSEENWGKVQIFPGDTLQVMSIEIAVDNLSEEDRKMCLKMHIRADAILDGESLYTQNTVEEFVG